MGAAILTTIDSAGRLVIPKAIREEAELAPGAPLRIEVFDGRVEISPAPREVVLERRGRLSVAVPREPSERLPESLVRDTIEAVRSGERPGR